MDTDNTTTEGGGIRYLSTFSGIGGFELGIHAAMPDAECIGYSEIDKYAISVYEHHFKEVKNYGNITDINTGQLPAFDLYVGGFPCQAFSVAGKRLGFDDTRGTLFFEVARILKAKRPRHLVLENVKGLLSHDGGKTFSTILGVLTDLGYFVEWQVLNSKDFGVPQNRERVYIVGHFGSAPRRKVFPITRDERQDSEAGGTPTQGAQAVATRHLDRNGGLLSDISPTVQVAETPHVVERRVTQVAQMYDNPHNSQSGRVYDSQGISPTIDVMQGGNRQPKIVDFNRKDGVGKELDVAHTLSAGDYRGLNRNQSQTAVMSVNPFITNPKMMNNKPNYNESVAITATSYKEPPVVSNIRRLTPVECERLQGFPDDWTKYGACKDRFCEQCFGLPADKDSCKEVSDTQRYKMCGNAVTTNVVQAVMERLFNDGH